MLHRWLIIFNVLIAFWMHGRSFKSNLLDNTWTIGILTNTTLSWKAIMHRQQATWQFSTIPGNWYLSVCTNSVKLIVKFAAWRTDCKMMSQVNACGRAVQTTYFLLKTHLSINWFFLLLSLDLRHYCGFPQHCAWFHGKCWLSDQSLTIFSFLLFCFLLLFSEQVHTLLWR